MISLKGRILIVSAVLSPTPSQDGVPLESALANDPWLLKAVRVGCEQVLRRPIVTATTIGQVKSYEGRQTEGLAVRQYRRPPAYSPALRTLRIALNSDPLTGRALFPVAIANRA
jgi:hypothetical protein